MKYFKELETKFIKMRRDDDARVLDLSIITSKFYNLTFADRFKLVNKILRKEAPELYHNYKINYGLYTASEWMKIKKIKRGIE